MKNFFGSGYWKNGYKLTPTAKDYFGDWSFKPNFGILLVPLAIVFAVAFVVTIFNFIFIYDAGNSILFRNENATTRVDYTRKYSNDSVKGDITFQYSERNHDGYYSTWRCESPFVGKYDNGVMHIILAKPEVRSHSPYVQGSNIRSIAGGLTVNLNKNGTIDIMGQTMLLEK